jgi:hypothetical protein
MVPLSRRGSHTVRSDRRGLSHPDAVRLHEARDGDYPTVAGPCGGGAPTCLFARHTHNATAAAPRCLHIYGCESQGSPPFQLAGSICGTDAPRGVADTETLYTLLPCVKRAMHTLPPPGQVMYTTVVSFKTTSDSRELSGGEEARHSFHNCGTARCAS